MMPCKDRHILRDLAKEYLDICASPIMPRRRDLWRAHNSLRQTRPLIYIRAFAWNEMPQSRCICEDPFLKSYENFFRRHLFWHTLNDDSIFEPWVTMPAVWTHTGWGTMGERCFSEESRGSYKMDYPLKTLEDIEKLKLPFHEIDEAKTIANLNRLTDCIGDIITIDLDRAPAYRMWSGDLATDLGALRGIEHLMLDMVDNPEWLHRLVGFMSEGVCKTHTEAEIKGDWGLSAHQNQAMPYAEELRDPAPNIHGVSRKDLWVFMAAQEFTAISPAMHEEFLLRYQIPILTHFGLVAYGCCEDLTHKISMLRSIPHLRRIAVSPFSDVAKCAEQIGKDYVLSYRPSPTDMVGYGFDEDRVCAILRKDLSSCAESYVDITLKDVETVEGDPERIKKWVVLVRNVIDEIWK